MKKRIAIIMMVVLSLFSFTAYADGESQGIGAVSGTCGDGLAWNLNEAGVLTVSGTGDMANYMASEVPWEMRKSFITSVVIGSGVTSIGDNAFRGCSNLSSVSWGEGLVAIGDYAFYQCQLLNTAIFPKNLERIGLSAFEGCYDLATVEMPVSITSIESRCFSGCYDLQNLKLSPGLKSIAMGSFSYSKIRDLTIPEGVVELCGGCFSVFSDNPTMTTVHLPTTLKIIEGGAFSGQGSITDVYYAGTQEEAENIVIGTDNTGLTGALWHYAMFHPTATISLPTSMITVETDAFSNISAQAIIIPESVENIYSRAFADCPNLYLICFEGSPAFIADVFWMDVKKLLFLVLDPVLLQSGHTD